MNGRRARGATARTAARRIAAGTCLRAAASAAAGRDTGAQGAPVGAQVESDAHVTLAVAEALEMAASRIRENGLAWFAERMADVDGQPKRLKPMRTTQDPPTNGAALLTQQDLAAYLGCNVRTLRRWVHEGRIPAPCLSIGRVQRWRRSDVDRLLEGPR